jgi:hypothetical protein
VEDCDDEKRSQLKQLSEAYIIGNKGQLIAAG